MYENSILNEKIEEFSKGRTVSISYVKGRNDVLDDFIKDIEQKKRLDRTSDKKKKDKKK